MSRFAYLTRAVRQFTGRVWRDQQSLLMLGFFGLALPLFLFWKIGEDVWKKGGFEDDTAILTYLHAQATPTLDALALRLSQLGGPGPLGALVVGILVLLGMRRQWGKARFFAVAFGGTMLLNLAAKALVGRVRPALWQSLAPETTLSFPSGHAMGAAALAVALGYLFWPTRWRWLVLVAGIGWAVGIGWSRNYLGVHYPSDVLAGWVAAVGWVTGVHLLLTHHTGWPAAPTEKKAVS